MCPFCKCIEIFCIFRKQRRIRTEELQTGVMEDRPLEPVTVQDVVRRENMLSALRTRMMGVVGRGG